jgi:hypothetical protein
MSPSSPDEQVPSILISRLSLLLPAPLCVRLALYVEYLGSRTRQLAFLLIHQKSTSIVYQNHGSGINLFNT